jgi:glycosyltransferase involved in cell wall biosynthesis
LLASGKLIPRKAPDVLIQAVRSLQSDGLRELAIVFLGDGEMADTLRNLASADPSVEVRFLGFRNQTQLSRYYHAADLLVLPSLEETWGLVVNEALLHGLPVVVSAKVGCWPDLVRPGLTGEISETGSQTGLAAAIRRALPLIRSAEVQTACRNAVEGYSVEQAASGVAAAYRDVTSGSLRPAA